MDYLFWLYILISVVVGLGGTVGFIKSDRTLGALLFLVGAVLVFTFYGIRWFQSDALNPGRYPTGQWPPVVNMCPDFLTSYNRKVGTKNERICVDMVGVSNAGIQKFKDRTQDTDVKYVFNLYENLKGNDRIKALCEECKKHQVTWEGIYDGASCVGYRDVSTPGTTSELICPPQI